MNIFNQLELSKKNSLTIWIKKGVNVDEVQNFKDFLDNEGFRYCILESNEEDDLDADFPNERWSEEMDSSFIKIVENGKATEYDLESFKEAYFKPLFRVETEVRYILPIDNMNLYNRAYTQLMNYVKQNNDRVFWLKEFTDYGQVLSVKIYKKQTSNYGCPYQVA